MLESRHAGKLISVPERRELTGGLALDAHSRIPAFAISTADNEENMRLISESGHPSTCNITNQPCYSTVIVQNHFKSACLLL